MVMRCGGISLVCQLLVLLFSAPQDREQFLLKRGKLTWKQEKQKEKLSKTRRRNGLRAKQRRASSTKWERVGGGQVSHEKRSLSGTEDIHFETAGLHGRGEGVMLRHVEALYPPTK